MVHLQILLVNLSGSIISNALKSKLPFECETWRSPALNLPLAEAEPVSRPEMVEGPALEIEAGRHPVLDVLMPPGAFVPNDLKLGPDDPDDLTVPILADEIGTLTCHVIVAGADLPT